MKIQFVICLSMLAAASGQMPEKAMKMESKPVLLTPADIKWMPAPLATGIPSVVGMTILSGDPSKTGMFTVRLKIPDSGVVNAHWHPTDEHITVLQGTFAAGMGDKFTTTGLHEFPAGSYMVMPRKMHHFATAKGETIVQVHAMGPFVLNYVNAADDPRKK